MIDYVALWNRAKEILAEAITDGGNEHPEQQIEKEAYKTILGLMNALEENAE